MSDLLVTLSLIPAIAKVLVAVLLRLLSAPFRSGSRAPDIYRDVGYTAIRTLLNSVTAAQERLSFVNPPTEKIYLEFCEKQGFQPDTEVISSTGTKLHWLGPKSAAKTILYFHGGGYARGCSMAHWTWLFELQNLLRRSGHDVSVAVLGYTRSTLAPYPTQLREAAESLNHVLGFKSPRDLVIGGDSAGGNLTMAIISHMLHPHPDTSIPHVFATTDASVVRNKGSDLIGTGVAHRWSAMFLGPHASDPYCEALKAPPEWFANLPVLTDRVLLWGGGGELLIDSICDLAKVLKGVIGDKLEFVEEPMAAHEAFIMDKALGYGTRGEKAEGTAVIEQWVGRQLSVS
ncbi:alpha/beta-hydrolase [Piedraia hortae CBS 480.64]|uniref:Alpha/beta-hydrolase n=1 Tax=Piedraia hortae CBS 480.64 TaxID=1314780 RepID=A0A6A7BTG6_9PEZI|nr:alpha/beta-hydrolase [Piedraia hortae CBS 480.64]